MKETVTLRLTPTVSREGLKPIHTGAENKLFTVHALLSFCVGRSHILKRSEVLPISTCL